MDLNDTPQQAEFRQKVRRWLEDHRSEAPAVSSTRAGAEDDGYVDARRAWQGKLAEGGLAGITWPAEYGGQGMGPIEQVVANQEIGKAGVPGILDVIGVGMLGPTLIAHGSDDQKQRYLGPMLHGDEVWCQLFSEPGAGSDLAGLRTRAQREGDEWVINGQKIWTSGAHWADWAILVARSDPKAAKHKGLTFFFLSMKSPGIETRRIKQISGASHFNEVYFTDVRIPDSQRLGAVGAGWGVAITTLMNERLSSGDLRGPDFEEVFGLARGISLEDGPALANASVRERLADIYVKTQGVRLTRFRTMTALSRGETPGPENSIGKLVNAPKAQEIASFAMDLLDMGGIVMDKDTAPLRAAFQESLLTSPGGRIAAGTDEILRNIIAERVLGLPQDVRVDRDLPFDQLPTGKR